jgi:Zn-dependent protease with chaperone function
VTSARWAAFWVAVIAVLLLVELAEVTRLFTLPVQSALGNLLAFVFALVFTTILALVGALFIGIYISQRISSSSGFSPFEEEMLKMRSDVTRLREEVAELRKAPDPPEGRP